MNELEHALASAHLPHRTIVPPGDSLHVDALDNLIIEVH